MSTLPSDFDLFKNISFSSQVKGNWPLSRIHQLYQGETKVEWLMFLVSSPVKKLTSNIWIHQRREKRAHMNKKTISTTSYLCESCRHSFSTSFLWLKGVFSYQVIYSQVAHAWTLSYSPVPENTCTTCCNLDRMALVLEIASVKLVCYWKLYLLCYMALSHKDWELPNSRIWLAEMDIDRGLDFPI